jgi:hypothetical protein
LRCAGGKKLGFFVFRCLGHEARKKQDFGDAASWITGCSILEARCWMNGLVDYWMVAALVPLMTLHPATSI